MSFEEKTWGILGSGVTNVAVYIQSIAKKAKIPSRGSLKDLTNTKNVSWNHLSMGRRASASSEFLDGSPVPLPMGLDLSRSLAQTIVRKKLKSIRKFEMIKQAQNNPNVLIDGKFDVAFEKKAKKVVNEVHKQALEAW